jgi:probable lipoprotein NlpC
VKREVVLLVLLIGCSRLVCSLETKGLDALELRFAVVDQARSYLDVGYSYGGSDAAGMDCSGLVYRVFLEAAGLRLPRAVADLYEHGSGLQGGLMPGDLVFFNTDGRTPSHVGIYIGDRRMIHAASDGPETGVIVSSLDESYYRLRYLQGRRILPAQQPEIVVDLSAAEPTLRLEQRVLAGYPLKILLRSNALEAGSFLKLSLEREGQPWLARRVRLVPAGADFWFTPSEGNWRVAWENAGRTVAGELLLSTSGRKP